MRNTNFSERDRRTLRFVDEQHTSHEELIDCPIIDA
jgi:hypothetical protein